MTPEDREYITKGLFAIYLMNLIYFCFTALLIAVLHIIK